MSLTILHDETDGHIVNCNCVGHLPTCRLSIETTAADDALPVIYDTRVMIDWGDEALFRTRLHANYCVW